MKMSWVVKADHGRAPLPALTSLRFIAAAMIVIGHADPAFGSLGLAQLVPLNQGVSFFFALSGFILYYNYSEFATAAQASHFLLARFARIWPSHVLCMLLFLVCVPRPLWYLPYPVPTFPTLLIVNILLVQSWIPFHDFILSLNGVAWSISVETFFYLSFPLLVIYKNYWRLHLGLFISIVVLTGALLVQNHVPIQSEGQGLDSLGLIYTNPLVRILEFIVGLLTARALMSTMSLQFKRGALPLLEIAAIVAVLVFLLCAQSVATWLGHFGANGNVAGYWLVNDGAFPTFALLIFIMARQDGPLVRILSWPPFVFLGEISFLIYLLHVTLLRSWAAHFGFLHNLPNAAQYAVFWSILLVSASLVHLTFERPVRKIILTAVPYPSLRA